MIINPMLKQDLKVQLERMLLRFCDEKTIGFLDKTINEYGDKLIRYFQASADIEIKHIVTALQQLDKSMPNNFPTVIAIESQIAKNRGIKAKAPRRHCFACDDMGFVEMLDREAIRDYPMMKYACSCPLGNLHPMMPKLPQPYWPYTSREEILMADIAPKERLVIRNSRPHFEALGIDYDTCLPGGKAHDYFIRHKGHISMEKLIEISKQEMSEESY